MAKLTIEEENQLIIDYQNNIKFKTLEKRYRTSEKFIKEFIQAKGIAPRKPPNFARKRYEVDLEAIKAQYYDMGLPITQVANNHHMSKDTLRKILTENGLPILPKKRDTERDIEKAIFDDYLTGRSMATLTDKYRKKRTAIVDTLRSGGIEYNMETGFAKKDIADFAERINIGDEIKILIPKRNTIGLANTIRFRVIKAKVTGKLPYMVLTERGTCSWADVYKVRNVKMGEEHE